MVELFLHELALKPHWGFDIKITFEIGFRAYANLQIKYIDNKIWPTLGGGGHTTAKESCRIHKTSQN